MNTALIMRRSAIEKERKNEQRGKKRTQLNHDRIVVIEDKEEQKKNG
jgi:hypothetical protein